MYDVSILLPLYFFVAFWFLFLFFFFNEFCKSKTWTRLAHTNHDHWLALDGERMTTIYQNDSNDSKTNFNHLVEEKKKKIEILTQNNATTEVLCRQFIIRSVDFKCWWNIRFNSDDIFLQFTFCCCCCKNIILKPDRMVLRTSLPVAFVEDDWLYATHKGHTRAIQNSRHTTHNEFLCIYVYIL